MDITIPVELIVQTILTGAIGWAVKQVLDKLSEYQKESRAWRVEIDKKVDSLNDATQATTRTTILHYCEKYISRNGVTSEELASLMDMYQKYTALNDHNGFIDGYIDRVQKLNIIEI